MASLHATKAEAFKTKPISLKRVSQALSKAVGFLRVLRFLPTRKVDRVVWVIKK